MSSPCSEILKWGIWDFQSVRTEEELINTYLEWHSRQNQGTINKSLDLSQSVGFIIPETNIPIEFKNNYSRKSQKTWNDFYNDYYKNDVDYKRRFNAEFKMVNSSLIEAWSNCIERKDGLRVWYQYFPDAINRTFILTLEYRQPRIPGAAQSISVESVECADENPCIDLQELKDRLVNQKLENMTRKFAFIFRNRNETKIIIKAGGYEELLHIERIPLLESECVTPSGNQCKKDVQTNTAIVEVPSYPIARKASIACIGRATVQSHETSKLNMFLKDERGLTIREVLGQKPSAGSTELFDYEFNIEYFIPANVRKQFILQVGNENATAIDRSAEMGVCYDDVALDSYF